MLKATAKLKNNPNELLCILTGFESDWICLRFSLGNELLNINHHYTAKVMYHYSKTVMVKSFLEKLE